MPKLIPFTFEDRDLFRNRWIRPNARVRSEIFSKTGQVQNAEHLPHTITHTGIDFTLGDRTVNLSYRSALDEFEFADGTPFGKEDKSLLIIKP
jgi:uncharacterized protein YifE (UPF0438 family)